MEIGSGGGIGEPTSQWVDAAFAHHNEDVGRLDGFVHKGQRKIVVMVYLRPSREQVAGGLEVRQSRRGIFLTGRVGSFCGDQGLAGKRWSPPRPESGWPCRRGKEEKGIQRAIEKRRKHHSS